MSVEIGAFISILGSANTLVRGLINERDSHKASAIKVELSEKILEAQAKFAEVLSTVIEKDGTIQTLRERVRELETNEAEKARYRLAKVGSRGQFFAYELRPAGELAERADEPPHFVCQPCFDAGKKGGLHLTSTDAICPICRRAAAIEPSKVTAAVRSRGIQHSRDW